MGNRAGLVAAYIDALEVTALLIHAGPCGRPAKIGLDRSANLELFDTLWFGKTAHAELVLASCRDDFRDLRADLPDGWTDLAARTVRDHAINVAGVLGARWRSETEIRADAEKAVAGIVDQVDRQRRNGGLAKVNAAYKIYRQVQLAKGEKAVPYSTHLATFTRSLVTLAGANARVI